MSTRTSWIYWRRWKLKQMDRSSFDRQRSSEISRAIGSLVDGGRYIRQKVANQKAAGEVMPTSLRNAGGAYDPSRNRWWSLVGRRSVELNDRLMHGWIETIRSPIRPQRTVHQGVH